MLLLPVLAYLTGNCAVEVPPARAIAELTRLTGVTQQTQSREEDVDFASSKMMTLSKKQPHKRTQVQQQVLHAEPGETASNTPTRENLLLLSAILPELVP